MTPRSRTSHIRPPPTSPNELDYSTAINWLYGTQLFGIKLGLAKMRELCDTLEIDPARRAFIHVAGTNGKGSVCAFAESIARHAGHRTGLFTSPHLVGFRERARVSGVQISEAETARLLTRIRSRAGDWDPHPTLFQIATAMALAHFQYARTDLVLMETGMGGRLDATNIITPRACAITPITLDHQQWLGETTAAIAAEKAGIFKPGVPVVSSPQEPGVREVLESTAQRIGCPISFAGNPVATPTGIPGPHQKQNAALASAALEAAGIRLDAGQLNRGISLTRWPGRFERIAPRTVLDGAHNPGAAAALATTWHDAFPNESATIVIGAVQPKDIDGILAALAPIARRFVFTRPDSPRAFEPGALAASPAGREVESICVPSPQDALDRAGTHPERILVTGSLFLVGQVRALLAPDEPPFEPSSQ